MGPDPPTAAVPLGERVSSERQTTPPYNRSIIQIEKSLYVNLPPVVADVLEVSKGDMVTVEVRERGIVIWPPNDHGHGPDPHARD